MLRHKKYLIFLAVFAVMQFNLQAAFAARVMLQAAPTAESLLPAEDDTTFGQDVGSAIDSAGETLSNTADTVGNFLGDTFNSIGDFFG
jgi:hypothetical protein